MLAQCSFYLSIILDLKYFTIMQAFCFVDLTKIRKSSYLYTRVL